MTSRMRRGLVRLSLPLAILVALPATAGYKLIRWAPRAIEAYSSQQTNDGITIAAEPLYTNALAAKAFDRKDMLSRGVLPLALIVHNSNDFAVEVSGESVELLMDDERLQTLDPVQALQHLYGARSRVIMPVPRRRSPLPTPPRANLPNVPKDANLDFNQKFFGHKRIFAHSTDGGFLYIPISDSTNLESRLSKARVYIPDTSRYGTGAKIMFFEFDLEAAVRAMRVK